MTQARTRIVRSLTSVVVIGFFLQWILAVACAPYLAPLRQRLPSMSLVTTKSSNGVFRVHESMYLGLPEYDSGLGIAGVPIRVDTPDTLISANYLDTTVGLGPMIADGVVHSPLRIHAPGWSVLSEHVDPEYLKSTLRIRVIEYAVGWPMRSVLGRVSLQLQYPTDTNPSSSWINPEYEWAVPAPAVIRYRNGVSIPPPEYPIRPLRPLLLGSMVNSVTYGSVLFVVYLLAKRLVRVFRRATHRLRVPPGHCRACGYSLGDLAKCPECGVVVRPTKRKRAR